MARASLNLFSSSILAMLQRRNPIADKSEGGDGCALGRETEIKLELFEKASEELQV